MGTQKLEANLHTNHLIYLIGDRTRIEAEMEIAATLKMGPGRLNCPN